MATGKGAACYLPRDLSKGTYGGDVFCLQQHLRAKGFISDAPTGYFGDKTEEAVARWQSTLGVTYGKGVVGLQTRQLYASNVGLPPPSLYGASTEEGPDKTCIDVCAEFGGTQDCQTRCVRDGADKKHACREACQTAFSAACDRAFPPSVEGGPQGFQTCLSYSEASCMDTCRQFN